MTTKCPTCGRSLDKTHEQRKLFHLICTKIGNELGHSPGQIKAAIKQEEFGIDEYKLGNKWYRTVKSSEDTDRVEYSALIEAAYRFAAEQGVYIK